MNRVLIGLLVCAVLIVATACAASRGALSARVPSDPDPQPSAGGTDHWLGAANAPTVVEEYSDLQ